MAKVKGKAGTVDLGLLERGIEQAEYELARRHFRHFLKFVKIEEPGVGPIRFEMWPHLEEMTEAQKREKLITRLKAKQIGISWWLASLAVWIGQFTPAGLMMMFSRGEREAYELVRKAKVVHRLLPEELRVEIEGSNMESIKFSSGGRILAYPSTMDAGIGETATCVGMDEADFHPYFTQNLTNIKPTVDAGGQLIIVSTSNPHVMESGFKKLYRGAPGNGYHKKFYGWRVRPGRDEEWYKAIMESSQDITTEQKNYPNNEDEALAPPRSIAAFDHEKLKGMQSDVKKPIEQMACGTVLANIYQDCQTGKRYTAGTDTSHGVGKDDAVTVVLDVATGYVVADIQTNLMAPEQLAEASVKLLERYQSPVWGIEDNDWGILTLKTAERLRYPRIYFRDEGKPGWHTDEFSRYELWGDLMSGISSRLFTIPSSEGLSQFYTVIKNPEKRGRIEAQQGAHDDYPLALGIAWQLRRYARPAGSGLRDRRGRAERDFSAFEFSPRGGEGWVRW